MTVGRDNEASFDSVQPSHYRCVSRSYPLLYLIDVWHCDIHTMASVAGPSRLGPRIARLPQRSVLEVAGPDARKFLNGQSCKNVEALGGGYSGFMNASVGRP